MNKNQLKKIITNLQNYVDDKIDKLPTSYEEKLLITVPKENIDKSKADAATNDKPYTIDIPEDRGFNYVDGMFNDADIIIEYNGNKYISYMIDNNDDSIIYGIILENNHFGFIIQKDNSFPIGLSILKLDTTNITDIKLYMRKKDFNIDDLQIGNSISIGRVGNIGVNSSAIGGKVRALGNYSHAEGSYTVASGTNSHAEGYMTSATSYCSHAEGLQTTASNNRSHAEGYRATASGNTSHAEGDGTKASGNTSHAEGSYTAASGPYSHAEGDSTIASGYASHVEGEATTASGKHQHVQGKYNIEDTENKYAHIVGNGSNNSARSNAHTLDWNGNAWYAGQVEGTNLPYNISSKVLATVPANSITLADEITVNNVPINKDKRYYIEFLGVKKLCSLSLDDEYGNSIVCSIKNYGIQAFNDSTNIKISISKINDNTTTDTFTDLVIHEEENKYLDSKCLETDLILQNSISLGRAGDIGPGSSAIGYAVEASGGYSHAEGIYTTASGDYSYAGGYSTKASGVQSHAEGSFTIASGDMSHAEGNTTTATGSASHAEGKSTKALGDNSHVQGKFNIEDTEGKYAHIVGNGSADNKRSNAHTLDWEGNAWYAGKLSQEGTPTEDKDLITKKYVDSIQPNTVEEIIFDAPLEKIQEGMTYATNNPSTAGWATCFFDIDITHKIQPGEIVYFEYGGNEFLSQVSSDKIVYFYAFDGVESDYNDAWTMPDNQIMCALQFDKDINKQTVENKCLVKLWDSKTNVTGAKLKIKHKKPIDDETFADDVKFWNSISMNRQKNHTLVDSALL